MIDRGHALSVTKQAEVVGIARSTVYYLPRAVSAEDLALMQRIDRLHLEFPFAGARMLRGLLAAEGRMVGRRHVKTLMLRMGIEALYRRPRTSKPEPGHKIYPYLLRGLAITRPRACRRSAWRPNPADDPLIPAENLSEQPGPPLPVCRTGFR